MIFTFHKNTISMFFTIKLIMLVVRTLPHISLSSGNLLGNYFNHKRLVVHGPFWLTYNPEGGFWIVLKFSFVLTYIESR